MKIDFSQFTSLFHRSRRLPHRDPDRDWVFIVISFFIATFAMVGVCIFLFVGIDQGTLFLDKRVEEPVTPLLDPAGLNSLKVHYAGKQTALEALKATSTTIVDPSL